MNTPFTVRRKAPATCGELVQGAINGQDLLVNCPIDRFVGASVRPCDEAGIHVTRPGQFAKVRDSLAWWNPIAVHPGGLEVTLHSDIPRGKGMASSSADLAAALTAVSVALGRPLDGISLSRIIALVEPSDSVHLGGIAHENQLNGECRARFPTPSDLSVLVVDSGSEVGTVGFDREVARELYRREQPIVAGALTLLRRGLVTGNLQAVADAATASAALSQQILHKPIFGELLATTVELGALGVNCAHSGTVLGVLHRASDGVAHRLQDAIDRRFGDSARVIGHHCVIGGGCRDW